MIMAIVCLETVLVPHRLPPSERLVRARELRAKLPQGRFNAREMDQLKRLGRL